MIILIFLLSADTIDFDVDPVVYKSKVEIKDTITETTREEDIFYIEFNCGIPYQKLHYEEIDSKNVAKAIIAFKLLNMERPDSLIDTLYRQFTVPSFREAAQQQTFFITQFGLHIPQGKFKYRIDISSGDKVGSVEDEISIKKENYRMSDILIANDIAKDTSEHHLRKGNLRIIPHPSHEFSELYETIYLYYELYDITPDSHHLRLSYTIKDDGGKIIGRIPRYIEKKYKSQAINFALSKKEMKPGRYTIVIDVKDESSQLITQKKTSFEITKPIKKEVSFDGMPYYDKIEYFLSTSEYKFFKNMPEEGKSSYLKRFWAQNDYFAIAERFEYADKNYRQGVKPGYKTDRGRIYVKYGAPDEIERSFIEHEESKPYEHWQYFNGFEFIFVDILGTNEYTLVWTNVRDERSQPTLYKHLPESIRQQIE